MSEKLNKVIANLPQAFTTAEQKQARDNIGAQKAISYGYSASSITSIDGSAVGNPASITGVDHDYNLSGSGTSALPLGLNDPIKFSGQGTAESSKVSGASAGFRGFRLEVPSAWTANMGNTGFKSNYEFPSAEDTAGLGDFRHGELGPGFMSLSSHDSQYIEHNVITASVYGRPWAGLFAGYQSGSNQTSIVACVGDANRVDPYLLFGFSGSSEYVDQSSIRRWNGVTAKQDASAMTSYVPFSSISGSAGKVTAINGSAISAGDTFTGVSAGNGISGNGTSGSPLGLGSTMFTESSNPLSYGYGGNQASAASQYNVSAGNWAARTLKASGIPDMTMYGFQNLPGTGGPFMVNAAGAFVEPPLPTFNLKVYKPTTQPIYLSTSDYPKMPATADGLLIIVNRGQGPYVTYSDGIGATSTLPNNNSAQLIWDCQASSWVKYNQ